MSFREWLAKWLRNRYVPVIGGDVGGWDIDADNFLAALHGAAKDPESGVRVVELECRSDTLSVVKQDARNITISNLNYGPGKAIMIWEPKEE